MESTRNTEETREGDNPRGQYPIPSCHRTIDQSKKEKRKEKKRVSGFGITGWKHKELELELGDV